MATIALRVPTVLPGTEPLAGGQCYLLFDRAVITVRELIAAKVRGELRKARAGGPITTSLPLLLPEGAKYGFSPLDEQLAIAQSATAFMNGRYLIVVNGRPLVDLDETIELDRRTRVSFVYAEEVIAKSIEVVLDKAA